MYYVILFAILLLFLILFLHKTNLVEGLENQDQEKYQTYTDNNPMILAEKNAANIEYLKSRLQDLQTLNKNFGSLEEKVDKNTSAIKQMSQLATQHLSSVTGISAATGTPPAVKKLSSISQNAGNIVNPITSPTTHISPSRPDPTAPLN